MPDQLKSVTWEALEHHHIEKKSDWFWIAGIVILTCTFTSIFLGNSLFGILVLVGGTVMVILASRQPKVLSYGVTQRGLRIDDKLYPYTTLEAYSIDEDEIFGPQLLVRSEKLLMPLLVLPLPEEYVDDIEEIVATRLPEEHLEEPLAHKLLEFLGF